MPSPFPGMDPYLEDPGLWPDVHHELISQLRAQLNERLRPKYFARVEERVYISDESDPGRSVIVPDVRVVEASRVKPAGIRPAAVSGGLTTAVLDRPEAIEVTSMIEQEIREARIVVVDRADRSVVTVIEVLSPSNKVAGSSGRESYLQKRREVIDSPSHLVEVDLLRAGEPIFTRPKLPPHAYLVHVSRRVDEQHRRVWVWPTRLQQALPEIPVPLRGDDAHVMIDLQQTLAQAYQTGAYDLDLDYSHDPIPPLSGEDAQWARELIKSQLSQ